MDYDKATVNAGGTGENQKVSVTIATATGTHHSLTLYERAANGRYEPIWSEGYPSRAGGLRLTAEVGSIVHQRATSPASAEPLERYGVVLPEGRVDWGADVVWEADFGPVGDVTRRGLRSLASSFSVDRGRSVAPHGEEVTGGAVSDASTTSTD